MTVILGIDAAWTERQPSGVALIHAGGAAPRCLGVAPSYDSFLALARGEAVNWTGSSFSGGLVNVGSLLEAAEHLAGSPVEIVAIDMPIATVGISSRRRADDAVSTEFGGRWCSAHTPNAERPGPLGRALSAAFDGAGYRIATTAENPHARRLIEVYPHPALLSLLRRNQRVPYKVAKSGRYWPGLSVAQRVENLLAEFTFIHAALAARMGAFGLKLPAAGNVTSVSGLKRYEDALDALVCAWVGSEHLAGRTVALGDDTAAIWCPSDVVRGPSGAAGSPCRQAD